MTLADVAYAGVAGKKIKLLGRAVRDGESGKVRAYVAPHLMDDSNPLAGVEDVFNAITVKGDATGDVMFYGRGAGKLPTASAVVADVIDAAKHLNTRKYLEWAEGGADVTADANELACRWYVRAAAKGETLCAAVEGELLTRTDGAEGEAACITANAMTRSELEQALKGVETLTVLRVLN